MGYKALGRKAINVVLAAACGGGSRWVTMRWVGRSSMLSLSQPAEEGRDGSQCFCGGLAGEVACGECALEIVAAGVAIHIEYFTTKVQARRNLGFHCLWKHLIG